MAKRVAGHQLTDQNWDEEEDDDVEEEEGYKIASEEVLSKRVFKKAKRRVAGNQESGEVVKKSPFGAFSGFAGFAGFTSAKISTTTSSSTKTTEVKSSSAISFPTTIASMKTASNNKNDFWKQPGAPVFSGDLKTSPPDASSVEESQTMKEPDSERETKYSEQITGLNISVLNWIRDHIDKNPLIDLSPVFSDYEKYMREIEEKYGHGTTGKLTGNNETPTSSKLDQHKTPENKTVDVSPLSSKDVSTSSKLGQHKTPENKTVDVSPLSSKDVSKPSFLSSTPVSQSETTNGQKGLSIKDPGFFSAASTLRPFTSIESTSKGNTETKQERIEEDSEEPGKHERKTIEEKDAFYTIRSKLFFKKGDQWQELGVGMLYLKPLGTKTQLLVRMETTVGKVLLNICLTASMPITRTGKNNIMLVTVPNPPVFLKPADGDNSKPVTYLIRVKGSVEADELHEKLSEEKEKV